jgi:hypothetical protein
MFSCKTWAEALAERCSWVLFNALIFSHLSQGGFKKGEALFVFWRFGGPFQLREHFDVENPDGAAPEVDLNRVAVQIVIGFSAFNKSQDVERSQAGREQHMTCFREVFLLRGNDSVVRAAVDRIDRFQESEKS